MVTADPFPEQRFTLDADQSVSLARGNLEQIGRGELL